MNKLPSHYHSSGIVLIKFVIQLPDTTFGAARAVALKGNVVGRGPSTRITSDGRTVRLKPIMDSWISSLVENLAEPHPRKRELHINGQDIAQGSPPHVQGGVQVFGSGHVQAVQPERRQRIHGTSIRRRFASVGAIDCLTCHPRCTYAYTKARVSCKCYPCSRIKRRMKVMKKKEDCDY